jgi:predicted glycoside hydrolase/deacetylase ChbG (UPF0249 family)/methylase of polypeptide subunit release factors
MPSRRVETAVGPLEIEAPEGVHALAPSTLELAGLLDVRPGERVLELGCGAGLLAVVAARLGASRVVATDLDERACRATEANARANGVTVETRQGDFLEAVRGERFDLVVFNPPQTPGPRPFGPKYGGPDGTLHFAKVLPHLEEHLRPGGRLLLHVISLVSRAALAPHLGRFLVEQRGESERPFTAAEYEGYAPGLFFYLEDLGRRGEAEIERTGTGHAFKNRYLRAWPRARGTRLVVNADDMGLSIAANDAAVRTFERGVVRSTSVVANGTATHDALEKLQVLARSRWGPLDAGLHANLSEGRPLGPPIDGLTTPGGGLPRPKREAWRRLSEGEVSARGIEREVAAQWEALRSRGLALSHIDGHQHVLSFPAARAPGIDLARREGVFLRVADEPAAFARGSPIEDELATIASNARELRAVAQGALKVDEFRGLAARVGPGNTLARMRAALENLPGGCLAELMVHPVVGDARGESEVEALTDPSWPDWLAERGIALASFERLLRERAR